MFYLSSADPTVSGLYPVEGAVDTTLQLTSPLEHKNTCSTTYSNISNTLLERVKKGLQIDMLESLVGELF